MYISHIYHIAYTHEKKFTTVAETYITLQMTDIELWCRQIEQNSQNSLLNRDII